MLVIRLSRIGKKNQPSFKIVVTRKTNPPRGGRFVEQVGFYNPLTKEKILNKERIQYWLSQGAKPSDTIYNLLIKEGIVAGKKVPLHKKSKKPAAEVKPAEAKPVEAEPAAKPGDKAVEVKPQPSETPKAAEAGKAEPAKEKKPEEKVAETKPQPKEETQPVAKKEGVVKEELVKEEKKEEAPEPKKE